MTVAFQRNKLAWPMAAAALAIAAALSGCTAGYHAGLPLGTWYPGRKNGMTVAVTEKRSKAEIDGLAAALRKAV